MLIENKCKEADDDARSARVETTAPVMTVEQIGVHVLDCSGFFPCNVMQLKTEGRHNADCLKRV